VVTIQYFPVDGGAQKLKIFSLGGGSIESSPLSGNFFKRYFF